MALTVGLSCAAVLVLLLATPIHIHLAFERQRAVRTRARVTLLFGLVRFRLHPRAGPGRAPEEERPGRRRGRLGTRIARRAAGGMLRPDLRSRSLRFLRDLLRAVRPRDVSVSARIGMDDPADTGQLWAILGPLDLLLSPHDIHLEPVFEEACFQYQARARVRLIPLQLLLMTLAFLASPPVLRVLVAR